MKQEHDIMLKPSTPALSPRTVLQRVLRVGLPQVVIVIAAFLYLASTYGTGHDKERQWFFLFRTVVLVMAGTLLSLWAIFFTGWNKKYTILVIGSLIALGWVLFRVEFDGDLKPSLHGRNWWLRQFDMSHEDDVKAHRLQQAATLAKREIDLTARPGDFPGYRGLDRTGMLPAQGLADDWEKNSPRELWKQPIYGGYSAFAVVNGFLFTLEQRDDREAVVCYDAANGNELWVHTWPGRFEESMGGVGPRSTPTVVDGDVYALGSNGHLVCLEGSTGKQKWSVETLEGNRNLQWAMSGSPLVYGDYVVVNPGTQAQQAVGQALVAYDRKTGKKRAAGGKTQAGYASPMLAELAGETHLLVFDGGGLAGYDPLTLEERWRHQWRTQGSDGINVAQPLVVESVREPTPLLGMVAGAAALQPLVERRGQVFIASAYGRGGAMLQVDKEGDGWSVAELWSTGRSTMRCKFASPVLRDDAIYGLDDGNLQCISANDGSVLWTDKRKPREGDGFGHGQLLLVDDLIVVLTQYGEIALVQARPDRFVELGRRKILEGDKTWNNPALAEGVLYIRNHLQMAAVDVRK